MAYDLYLVGKLYQASALIKRTESRLLSDHGIA
jgi:hypothetical protein